MLKVKGAVLKKDYPLLIQYVGSKGVLEFSQVLEKESPLSVEVEPEVLLRQVEEVIEYLIPGKQQSLLNLIIEKPEVDEVEFSRIEKEIKFEFIYTYYKDLIKEEEALKKEIGNASNDIQTIKPINNLSSSPQDFIDSKFFSYRIGSFKKKDWIMFQDAFEGKRDQLESLNIRKISELQEYMYILLAWDRRDNEKVISFLADYFFKPIDTSYYLVYDSTSFAEIYNLIIQKKEEAEKRLKEVEKEKNDLIPYLPQVKLYYDYLQSQVARKDALEKMGGTNLCLFFQGWIKAHDYEDLKYGFTKIFPYGFLEAYSPQVDDSPPVCLENPRWLRPYEVITTFFGLPGYWGMDPTPILAAPFTLFFAINLGDAGYAIFLFMISLFLYKKYSLNEGTLKAIGLAFYLSGATFLVGILTWTWFGYSPGVTTGGKILGYLPLIDPWESLGLMKSIVFVLVMGILTQYWGILNRFWFNLKRGDYKSAWLDQGVWLLLLSSTLLFASTSVFPALLSYKKIIIYLFFISLILTVFTQGRSSKSWTGRIILGLVSLYGFMGYYGLGAFLQDVLSYSRLIALNLTSSGVAKALNNIIDLMTSGVGWIVVPIAWILFHLFNLAMGLLGAFVHAFRLQAIELFGRFYEGGGNSFKPLGFKTSYVKVIQTKLQKEEKQ